MNRLHRRSSTVALAIALAGLTACAESAPDEATPTAVDQGLPQGNQDPGKTANTGDEGNTAPAKHKPNVDPRRGNIDEGARVDLRPKAEEPKDPPVDKEPPAKEPPKPLDGKLDDGKTIDLTPAEEAPSRSRKRMNIDQLNAALREVSGGIGWTTGKGWDGKAAGSDNLQTLALTLGKPNYTDLTTEDLEPGALFQKFLADAASSVCLKLINRDSAEKSAKKRILLRHVEATDTVGSNPGGVDKNLAQLLLRFHGRKVAPNADEMQQWRFLFTSATKVSKSPTMGWRAVCVALIQHPRFYTY